MVLGQAHAGAADGVDADDPLRPRREHQVPHHVLAVRTDPQQDERADLGVLDLRVVEALLGLVDRLGSRSLSALPSWVVTAGPLRTRRCSLSP